MNKINIFLIKYKYSQLILMLITYILIRVCFIESMAMCEGWDILIRSEVSEQQNTEYLQRIELAEKTKVLQERENAKMKMQPVFKELILFTRNPLPLDVKFKAKNILANIWATEQAYVEAQAKFKAIETAISVSDPKYSRNDLYEAINHAKSAKSLRDTALLKLNETSLLALMEPTMKPKFTVYPLEVILRSQVFIEYDLKVLHLMTKLIWLDIVPAQVYDLNSEKIQTILNEMRRLGLGMKPNDTQRYHLEVLSYTRNPVLTHVLACYHYLTLQPYPVILPTNPTANVLFHECLKYALKINGNEELKNDLYVAKDIQINVQEHANDIKETDLRSTARTLDDIMVKHSNLLQELDVEVKRCSNRNEKIKINKQIKEIMLKFDIAKAKRNEILDKLGINHD